MSKHPHTITPSGYFVSWIVAVSFHSPGVTRTHNAVWPEMEAAFVADHDVQLLARPLGPVHLCQHVPTELDPPLNLSSRQLLLMEPWPPFESKSVAHSTDRCAIAMRVELRIHTGRFLLIPNPGVRQSIRFNERGHLIIS
jgi:hypothetical protein